jgi:hypothetical protein
MLNKAPDAIKAVTFGQKTFCKFLSANDTDPKQSHQAGIYIPHNSSSILFNSPGNKGENKDRIVSVFCHLDNEYLYDDVRLIYYGRGTRNEYRITHTPFFKPEYTGALFVLTQSDEDNYQAFILNTDDEINQFLDAFGISPYETNCLVNNDKLVSDNELIHKFIQEIDDRGEEFPDSKTMSAAAREICDKTKASQRLIITDPDKKILDWTHMEYNIFKAVEYSRYGNIVSKGFPSVDEFVDMANQVLNRRKSRAGKSLEHHLAALFDGNNLQYEEQIVTEGNKRPDFIFPSKKAYQDLTYPTNKLISLAAKTTCKDRWRQVLNEANRLKDDYKYLCTLQQGISTAQLDEMQAEKVRLIVPKPYIEAYPKERRQEIWSLEKFIAYVREVIG